MADKRWYAVHTYSGFENKAKKSLEEKIRMEGLQDSFGEILIPVEQVVEMVKGEKKTSKRKFLPGYLLVKMELDDELWHIVKNTAKISGFVGSGAKPTPIPEDDVRRMLGQTQSSKPKPVVTFEEGEDVRVIHGPFSSFSGVVGEVKPEKEQVQVLVAVFGRSTPVWLSYEHVEKV